MRSSMLLHRRLPARRADHERAARAGRGGLPDHVLEGIQVKTRHWIADIHTGEQSESNLQMAAKAARQALARAESSGRRSIC